MQRSTHVREVAVDATGRGLTGRVAAPSLQLRGDSLEELPEGRWPLLLAQGVRLAPVLQTPGDTLQPGPATRLPNIVPALSNTVHSHSRQAKEGQSSVRPHQLIDAADVIRVQPMWAGTQHLNCTWVHGSSWPIRPARNSPPCIPALKYPSA